GRRRRALRGRCIFGLNRRARHVRNMLPLLTLRMNRNRGAAGGGEPAAVRTGPGPRRGGPSVLLPAVGGATTPPPCIVPAGGGAFIFSCSCPAGHLIEQRPLPVVARGRLHRLAQELVGAGRGHPAARRAHDELLAEQVRLDLVAEGVVGQVHGGG